MKKEKAFDKLVREIELEEFPEFKESVERGGVMGNIKRIIEPIDDSNIFFAPSHHIEDGLLTKEIIMELKEHDKYLLSVGSGPSYLERLLVKRFGVSVEKITLTDISSKYIPNGFQFYRFNMYRDWPNFEKIFDYIIFPSSFCSFAQFKSENFVDKIAHLFRNCLKNLNPSGQARINDYDYDNKVIYNGAFEKIKVEYPSARLSFDREDTKFRRDGVMILEKTSYHDTKS